MLIADHEPIVRFGVTELLKKEANFQVCGEAGSAPAARSLCESQRPDVLVLDPALSGGEGFALIKEATAWNPLVRVVAFTRLEDADSMIQAFRAGALAYVTHREPLEELVTAIAAAFAGEEHMGPRTRHMFVSNLRSGCVEMQSSVSKLLSGRETQIFRLLGEGRSKREIADDLHLSIKTVDTHQQRIKTKLKIGSCAALRQHAAVYQHRSSSEPADGQMELPKNSGTKSRVARGRKTADPICAVPLHGRNSRTRAAR